MKKSKHLFVLLTLMLFISASILSMPVSALETKLPETSIHETEKSTETENESAIETQNTSEIESESIIETQIFPETTSDSEIHMESESELEIEKSLTENSFRYTDGVLSIFEQAAPLHGIAPWTFTNGSWTDAYGQPILGAVQKGIDVSHTEEN